MNTVYIRMALYIIAAPAAAIGFGVFDPVSGTLTLRMDDIAATLAASASLSGIVFSLWGKK